MRALEQIALVLQWTVAAVVLAVTIWLLGDVLLLVFAAALVAAGLRGGAKLLRRASGLGAGASLAIVILALVLLLGGCAWWAGPRLASEGAQLEDQLLQQASALRAWLEARPWGRGLLHELPASLGGRATGSDLVPRLSGTIAGALWSVIGVGGTLVLVSAAALYFAAAPEPYVNGPLQLIPKRHRQGSRQVLDDVAVIMQSWLAGQLLDMLVVGVVTGAGLALLGVPLPFVLGFIAGLCNFVPYVGAISGAVPAILIGFSEGPQQALFVAALFLVVQTVEGNVLAPLIQRQAVDLPPAATILAQTALGALFGLPGVILATPIAAAILAALRAITSNDR